MTRYIGCTIVAMLFLCTAHAQVKFKLELLPDNSTYRVSMVPSVTWTFPNNITASAQITIKVPHADSPYGFIVGNLMSIQPMTEWKDNVRIYAPIEAPTWDYISFGLISGATSSFNYVQDVDIPLFEFTNLAESCVGVLQLVDNQTDPFLPPNSVNANVANSITVLGGGLTNACWGYVGNGQVPCLPNPLCTVFGPDNQVFICQGDTFQGQIFFQDTTLFEHFLSEQGCDSAITHHINVQVPLETHLNLTLCSSSIFNGVAILQDTVLMEANQSSFGCDSTVYYHIDAVDFYLENQAVSICSGTQFNGISIENDTILFIELTSSNGCDSIVKINVSAAEQLENHVFLTACEGEIVHGHVMMADTILIDTFLSNSGCDSVVITTIDVPPLPKPQIDLHKKECENKLKIGQYSNYVWNTGETTPEINIYTSGIYSITVTDVNGCTATASYDYGGSVNISAELEIVQPGCEVHGYGEIKFLNIQGGHAPYIYSINNGLVYSDSPKFPGLEAGRYQALVEDALGCVWTREALVQEPLDVFLAVYNQAIINMGESVGLSIASNYPIDSITWYPLDGLSCGNCPKVEATPFETTTYYATVYTENGCIRSLESTVSVNEKQRVYIPNAISNNGDGVNDFFCVYAAPEVEILNSVVIFDRYGGMLYQSENLKPNTPLKDWVLKRDDMELGQNIFVYMVELTLINGQKRILSGEFIMLK